MRFLGHTFAGNPRNIAKLVETTKFHAEDFQSVSSMLRCFVVLFLILPSICILGVVNVRQTAGVHCPELTVSTGLESYAGLSGLYRWDGNFSNHRAVYRQLHPSGQDFGGRYRIVHCGATDSWAFVKINEGQDAQLLCQSNWMIMSEPDESYDIFTPGNWVYFTRALGVNIAPDFILNCNSCEKENELVHCNRGGSCVEGRCQCRDGGYGPTCAFSAPCRVVSIEGVVQDGYGGKFTLLENKGTRENAPGIDAFHRMPPWYSKGNKTVSTSLRPVYLNRCSASTELGTLPPTCTGTTTVLFHDGVRWLMTRPSVLSPDLHDSASNALIEEFFDQFHPEDYVMTDRVEVYSSQTPGASPEDAEEWYIDGFISEMLIECEEVDVNEAKFIAADHETDFFPDQSGGGAGPAIKPPSSPPPPPPAPPPGTRAAAPQASPNLLRPGGKLLFVAGSEFRV